MSLTQFAAVAVSFLLIAGPPARAAPLKTVYTIPGLVDGAQPISALVKAGGAYYGTAPYGGTGFSGTIFKIDIKTGAYRIVHNFAGPDGSTPSAALLHYNSLLYGTTRYGGQDDVGTIFSFNPATGVLTSLASFTAGTGDAEPVAPLIAYNGLLYGTSVFGGNAESGTIFSFNPAAGTETTLYRFTGFNGDGAFPQAALTVLGNTLYGTTSQGGTNLFGTIFSFNPATGTEQSLYSFQNGADGGFPTAPLLAARRRLYGAASSGGTFGAGDVFSFDPSGARFTPVYSFTGAKDGAAPEAGLVALNGKLYGTASSAPAAAEPPSNSIPPPDKRPPCTCSKAPTMARRRSPPSLPKTTIWSAPRNSADSPIRALCSASISRRYRKPCRTISLAPCCRIQRH